MVVANPEGPNGVITGSDDGKLMLVGWQPGSDETEQIVITPDDQTQFLVSGRPGALTDLRSQMPVSVVSLGDGTGQMIVASGFYWRNAIVVGVEGEDLMVRQRFPELRIVVDKTMQISVDGAAVQLAELAKIFELAQVGLAPPMQVYIVTNRARRGAPERADIIVRTDSWSGTILEVRGDYITVDKTFLGKPIRGSMAIDDTTAVCFGGIVREAMRLPPRIGTMRELQPGMQVTVTPREWGPPTTIYVNSLFPLTAQPVRTQAPGRRF